jgi:hypothetical protein
MEKQRNILYDAFAGNILLQDVCAKKKKILYNDAIYPCDEFIWCLMMMMTILRYIDVVERAVCYQQCLSVYVGIVLSSVIG